MVMKSPGFIAAILGPVLLILMVCSTVYGQSYPIVDTGQEKCYDNSWEIGAPQPGEAFYGQDAQIEGHRPSYVISGDGLTVYDNVTGLTWMRDADLDGDGDIDVDDKLTFDGAQSYPDTLNAQNYGGYDDWRVPTIKDLYSLIDFRGTDPPPEGADTTGLIPFIDVDSFDFAYGDMAAGERIIDSQWVTSTLYLGTVMGGQQAMFGVNFADGRIKGYGLSMPMRAEKTFYVRLCRGNPDYGINDFTDNGDGTITDNATGLMWSQDDNGAGLNWQDALAWVEQMNDQNYLGHDDWRLPNVKELQSIVDYNRSPDVTSSAAIDSVFGVTQITNVAGQVDYPFYWSGTTHVRWNGSGGAGAYVAFGRGLGSMDGINVIDVHGAGCQRSDPKDGDPEDYPSWGHGPQGDLQRVFNYVRLVRDAGATGVDDPHSEAPGLPKRFDLCQNYPNPFNPVTSIGYSLPTSAAVDLSVYNLLGQRVKTLISGTQPAGDHEVIWDSTDENGLSVASGIYICLMIAGGQRATRKMCLMR
jgi:hypothetical protein